MAIQKRTKDNGRTVSYQVAVSLPNPVGGRGRRVVVGSYRTRKLAEAAERRAKDEIASGTFIAPTDAKAAAASKRLPMTLADAMDGWLAGLTAAGKVTANTYAGYEIAVRKHVRPVLGDIPLAELTRADVKRLVRGLQDRKLGAQVQNRCVLVVRKALAEAVEDGVIPANVAVGIDLPSPKSTKEVPEWTPAQLRAFLAAGEDDQIGPAGWHLLAVEGLRRGEMLGLRWSDVTWSQDGASATATIAQTVAPDMAAGGAAVIQGRTKTRAGRRAVALTKATCDALRRHRDRQAWQRRDAGEAWSTNDLVVCDAVGQPFRPDSVRTYFRKAIERAGVPEMTPHQLRHGAISAMVRAGVPLAIVAAKVGHADVGVTFSTYSHLAPADQASANAALDRLLATGTDGES